MFNSKSPTWIVNNARRVIMLLPLTGLVALLAACGGGSAQPQPSVQATSAPAPTSAAPTAKAVSNEPRPPQACALLTAADVQKITGYGNGLADSAPLGEGATSCTIIAGQGKVRVEVGAGKGVFPILPPAKTVDLEGGGKGIVKPSGIGDQGWMSLVQFPGYGVTLLFGGTATALDPDKKIANVTKADGSVITYAQAYEALARAVAHNAASGASMPSSVTDISTMKDDPCALLTLDEVKQAMAGFTVTAPESSDSAWGTKKCQFRATNDSLKAIGFVTIVYFTQAQFEQNISSGTGKKSDIGGAMAYEFPGGLILLNKGNRYVRFSIDLQVNEFNPSTKLTEMMRVAPQQLAFKIVARLK